MANTEDRLVQILQRYCGERGDSEGAVETLERIIRERDDRATKIVALEAELLPLREVAEATKELVAQCKSMGRASHTMAVIDRVQATLAAWEASKEGRKP